MAISDHAHNRYQNVFLFKIASQGHPAHDDDVEREKSGILTMDWLLGVPVNVPLPPFDTQYLELASLNVGGGVYTLVNMLPCADNSFDTQLGKSCLDHCILFFSKPINFCIDIMVVTNIYCNLREKDTTGA